MPGRCYFYHLKLELYDSPTPAIPQSGGKATAPGGRSFEENIHVPLSGTDIFTSNFPVHTRPSSGEQPGRRNGVAGRIAGTVPATQANVSLKTNPQIIDCGPSRADDDYTSARNGTSSASLSGPQGELQRQSKEHTAELAVQDWRFGPVRMESLDMGSLRDRASAASIMTGSSQATNSGTREAIPSLKRGINAGPRGHSTKAKFKPLSRDTADGTRLKNTELGWGIVHLYRDGEETPDLGPASDVSQSPTPIQTHGISPQQAVDRTEQDPGEQLDTTILCIPAVPSYMTPSDFLGWVGEKTREEVSHFRMVMTGRMNRYLVLMKFRDARIASKWRQEWDGRVFGGLEPENCHVMFIKSIVFQTPSEQANGSFPDTSQDPFTPSLGVATDPGVSANLALKPFPPPTPSLVELPTCPVCLERMDDTTGLLTILCQHVFHCACLTKWRGSGCPVCRHTQPQPSLTQPFGTSASNLCRVCDCSEDLWICLICGHVGCGRYKGGHAKEHWKETAHNYALEIETQHVWDYAGDLWVHRLIQTKGDGKLVELPSSSRPSNGFGASRADREEDVEMVPRVKLENIGMEYTNLLTSQLESQRAYYEDIVKKAVAKASVASKTAEAAARKAEESISALKQLTTDHARLRDEVVPNLEKEAERMRIKAQKSGDLARSLTKSWQEEKKVGEGLMERIKHINESMASLSKELIKAKEECEDLKEQNRDLGFFISGQEKLKKMEGQLGDEVTEGTVSLPERKEKEARGKGKGKGRGK